MPFIGRDWRSPGEVWVKTDEGWEKIKLLQNSNIIRSHIHEQ
jgi:F-box protein 25/32